MKGFLAGLAFLYGLINLWIGLAAGYECSGMLLLDSAILLACSLLLSPFYE